MSVVSLVVSFTTGSWVMFEAQGALFVPFSRSEGIVCYLGKDAWCWLLGFVVHSCRGMPGICHVRLRQVAIFNFRFRKVTCCTVSLIIGSNARHHIKCVAPLALFGASPMMPPATLMLPTVALLGA